MGITITGGFATYSVLVGAAENLAPTDHIPDEDAVVILLSRLPPVQFCNTHQGLTVVGEFQMMYVTCIGQFTVGRVCDDIIPRYSTS